MVSNLEDSIKLKSTPEIIKKIFDCRMNTLHGFIQHPAQGKIGPYDKDMYYEDYTFLAERGNLSSKDQFVKDYYSDHKGINDLKRRVKKWSEKQWNFFKENVEEMSKLYTLMDYQKHMEYLQKGKLLFEEYMPEIMKETEKETRAYNQQKLQMQEKEREEERKQAYHKSLKDKISNGYLLSISAQDYAAANEISLKDYEMRMVKGNEMQIADQGMKLNAEVIVALKEEGDTSKYIGTALISRFNLEGLVNSST